MFVCRGANATKPERTRHWDAGSEVAFDDDSEFLDYTTGSHAAHDNDDARSLAGMSTISTRSGRMGPVSYDDIVGPADAEAASMNHPRSTGSSSRGGRAGKQRGAKEQRGGRGKGRDGRGGAGGTDTAGSSRGRNHHGDRQLGQGSGRGGRGGGGGGRASQSHQQSRAQRELSPTSLAIARATGEVPHLPQPQATGFAQPMAASQQQQPLDMQMNMSYGWPQQSMGMQAMPQPFWGMGMGMPYHPQMPMFGGQWPGMHQPQHPQPQQQQQQQQQGMGQGAFNPAFAARMMQMGMSMGMGGISPQPQGQQSQVPQQDNGHSQTGQSNHQSGTEGQD